MRTTFIVITTLVVLFASYVVSKAPAESYGPAECVAPAMSAITAPELPEEAVIPEEKPFDRERPDEGAGLAERASMTVEQLMKLPDDQLMAEIRSRLLAKREAKGGIENLNRTEQTVLRAEAFGIKITQDGMLEFYSGPWGDYDATVAALTDVGANDMVALMQKSLAVFGGKKPPANVDERISMLSGLLQNAEMSPFEEIDQAALPLMGAYADLVAQYTRKNMAMLDIPPSVGSTARGQ